MSGLPSTFTRGFGIASVSGRMRVPKPAASTMAVRGIVRDGAMSSFSDGLQRRHIRRVPGLQRCQGWMFQRALEIAPYARDVTQILRLAVAAIEPREDAEDLRRALRREGGIEPRELRRVECRVRRAPRAHVA